MMDRALLLFRLPEYEFGPALRAGWLRRGALLAFLLGVGAGFAHARALGLL